MKAKIIIQVLVGALFVCLSITGNAIATPSSLSTDMTQLSNGPCGDPGLDACADIGEPVDEAFHSLSGWYTNEIGGPVIPTSGDPTKRFQGLRASNSVTLRVPEANVPYTLYTEVEDGGCDDSWEILVNGQGPIYTYHGTTSFNTQFAHQVEIAASLVSSTSVSITYRNIASDSCGLAAVYFLKLSKSSGSSQCTLNNVPIFFQGSPSTPNGLPNTPPWYNKTYGNYENGDAYNTMGRWGCNTTSNAMIIDYLSIQSNNSFQTDPGTLNDWLRHNHGYNASNGVIYSQITRYSSNNGVPVSVIGIGAPDNQRLDAHLCAGKPAMLKVITSYGTHFVVAVGKTNINGEPTYKINDPIWGQTTLKEHYGGSYQAVYYYDSSANRSSIEVSAHSPIHLLVIDPFGRKAGYDPISGQSWQEIPGSGYLSETIQEPDGGSLPMAKLLFIPQPVDGDYLIQAIGYGNGPYTIQVSSTDVAGSTITTNYSGIAQNGDTEEWPVDYHSGNLLYLPLVSTK